MIKERYLSLEFLKHDDSAENFKQVVFARSNVACLERANSAVSGRVGDDKRRDNRIARLLDCGDVEGDEQVAALDFLTVGDVNLKVFAVEFDGDRCA